MISLESISNAKRIRAPRIVLLGTPGIGKSEFAAGADSPVFLPIKGEEGIDGLDVPAFPVITTFEEVLETIEVLYSDKHEYKTLVIDSVSTLAPLVDMAAIEHEGVKSKALVGGGWGRGYDTILNLWRDLKNGLDALRNDFNMTTILIDHVKIKSSRVPGVESYDQYAFDVDGKVSDSLISWADCVLFMNRQPAMVKKDDAGFGKKEKRGIDVTGGQRFLFTEEAPTHPGKKRTIFGDLPAEIPLPRKNAWGTFMDAVAAAAQ